MRSNPMSATKENMRDLLTTDALSLAGFGIERICSAAPLWEERLTVDAEGAVQLSTRRSLSDVSGESIGTFGQPGRRDVLMQIVAALQAVNWPAPMGAAPRPYAMQIRLSTVLNGELRSVALPVEPQSLAPLAPLLQLLDRLAAEVRQRPVRSLALAAECAAPRAQGTHELTLALRLRNKGEAGYWVTAPGSTAAAETDSCTLYFAALPKPEPGVTPLPVTPRTALLRSVTSSEPLIWIGPHSEYVQHLRGRVDLDSAGTWSMRIGFATYSGEDTIAGQPRMRGCAFSNDLGLGV
jgi:hypothetical protein